MFLKTAPTSKSCEFQSPENVDPPLVPTYFQVPYFMTKVCTNLQRKPPEAGTGDTSQRAWGEAKGKKAYILVLCVSSWSFPEATPNGGVGLCGSPSCLTFQDR